MFPTQTSGPFKGRITILVLGEGLVQQGAVDIKNPHAPDQTDTMILASIDPQTGQASVLSIPRDTLVDIPQAGGIVKINEANFVGGPTLAVQTVEKLLHVPIDGYVETSIWNFPNIIDALGGLTVDVPYPMHYGTATGPGAYLNINLNPGVQHLNGQQVLEFVRYRHEALGDIGRIQQQQYIIKLILKKVLRPSELPHLPHIIGMLRQDIVATNLSTQEMLALGLVGSRWQLNQMRYATLPGYPINFLDPVTHQWMNGWHSDKHLYPLMRDDVLLSHLTRYDKAHLTLVVRSGTASLSQARQLAAWLRAQGFQVGPVAWANQHNHTTNEIVDYTGDKYLSQRLAAALGPLGATRVVESPYHDVRGLDMTITVGSDFHLNPNTKL